MAFNPGQTVVNHGTFTASTCTTEYDLVANSIAKPEIQQWLEYVDQRNLTTLLTSGVVTPYGIKNPEKLRTDIPEISDATQISDSAYRFNVMGRIEYASEIISQIGSTSSDGTFQLLMKDNLLKPGMNALFNGAGFQARVMTYPQGGPGNFVYTFQSPDGATFDWTTHVAGQNGAKTCFGGYTSFGEGSLRGYGYSAFPDTFIVHTTIQRETCQITGDAATRVLWYKYNGLEGTTEGWMYEQVAQARAKFSIQDEFQKWFGISSMKNTDKTLRPVSRLTDPETGIPITQGDGIEQQIAGGNEFTASGTDGNATVDDFADMVQAILEKSNLYNGLNLICVTGIEGYRNVQSKIPLLAASQSTTFFQEVGGPGTDKIGGVEVAGGLHFQKINLFGNTIHFIMHPMFNDRQKFTQYNSYGQLVQGATYYFIALNSDTSGRKNMEIMSKGSKGINRSMVMAILNGMTGKSGETVLSEQDAIKYALLKQDLIVVRKPMLAGIIRPAA